MSAFGFSAKRLKFVPINSPTISGVTAPVTLNTPATTATGTGFKATITWNGNPISFAYNTQYTATITLTAASGYTLNGVAANFFTVAGATTVTSPANTGQTTTVVTAAFPSTAALPAGYIQTGRATGGTIGSAAGWTLNGGGTLLWSKVTTLTNWSSAAAQCQAMGSGWRMPTQGELSGLFFTSSAINAANAAGWTLTGTWSSSLYSADDHYTVNLATGGVGDLDDTYGLYMSCVKTLS